MNERKQKERNNDPKKDQPPQSFILSVHFKSHRRHAVMAITYISVRMFISLNYRVSQIQANYSALSIRGGTGGPFLPQPT